MKKYFLTFSMFTAFLFSAGALVSYAETTFPILQAVRPALICTTISATTDLAKGTVQKPTR
ncbi:MAG: hypothetical protein PHV42_03900, partial [Candidatus Pacebacteria bacterium]|nr:hypothetical protein [Candidatus Paceibacterota bacterium]